MVSRPPFVGARGSKEGDFSLETKAMSSSRKPNEGLKPWAKGRNPIGIDFGPMR